MDKTCYFGVPFAFLNDREKEIWAGLPKRLPSLGYWKARKVFNKKDEKKAKIPARNNSCCNIWMYEKDCPKT